MKNKLVYLLCLSMLFTFLPGMEVKAEESGEMPAMEEYRSGSLYKEADQQVRVEEDYVRVHVNNEEDLYELAENCRLDTWSRNKLILLNADIVLTEPDFYIPVFSGIFEGNGHSISNCRVSAKRDDTGLFRYIQQGAQVRNLTVEGCILPDGNTKNTGGIAGHNYGEIYNCIFKGTMQGEYNTGGIAGINEAEGRISVDL